MKTTKPYGSWSSPITSQSVAAGTIRFGEVVCEGEDLYWTEARPTEGGRSTIMHRNREGAVRECLPPPWNARSRVHEYGGGAFTAHRGTLFFVNFSDQRVYRLAEGAEPRPLTPASAWRYADLQVDARRRRIIAVAEDHGGPGEARNFLAAFDWDGSPLASPRALAEGHDFFAAPRLSPDGDQLAWLTWDHPQMPWDSSLLWVAPLDESGTPGALTRVTRGGEEAIFQPTWSPQGVLHFVSDRTGWWNLYRLRGENTEALLPMEAEFGLPQWVFGMSTYAFDPQGRILCSYLKDGMATLAWLDGDPARLNPIATDYREFQFVKSGTRSAAFIAGAPSLVSRIARLDFATGKIETVRSSRESSFPEGFLSFAEPISFPSANGRTAHGFFYAPRNQDFAADPKEVPPLIVISHGGPTGAATPTLALGIQYWTSRGFAVLDVNYGGSTGYGREYRNLLRHQWGIVDVEDCLAGATHLAAAGRADRNRLMIRGGSAGGYTTLCALTFHSLFRAGASHFGVSDIEALLKDTHKFESRYDHFLIGPYHTSQHLYRQRSPIHSTDRLNCPLILFQGLEDKVVPPNQAEMFFEAAKKKGLPVAYVPFEGEQHGFRKAENIARSLEAELYFYSRVFGFETAEQIPPVRIENL